MQFVMWFGGLRGAIAFALALNFPDERSRPTVISCTIFIVMFTTVRPLDRYLYLCFSPSYTYSRLTPHSFPLSLLYLFIHHQLLMGSATGAVVKAAGLSRAGMRECLSEAEHGGGDDDEEAAAADGHARDDGGEEALLLLGPVQSLKARWKKFDRGVLKGMFRYQQPPPASSAAERDPSRAESQMSLNGGGAGGNPGAADIFLRVRQQCNDPFFSSEAPLERGGRTARFRRRPASHAEQPSQSAAAAQRRSSTLRQAAASFGGGGGLGKQQQQQQQRNNERGSSLLQASGGAAGECGAGEGIADLRQSLLDSHATLAARTLPASTDHHDNGAEQSEA